MLARFNAFLQKWMPLLTPLSLVVGVFLEGIGQQLLFLVPWLFAFMTVVSSLSLKVRDMKVFINYPKTILFSIAFLHILMPLWAYIVSLVLFDDHLLTVGFIIAVAVPTGVTSIIWISLCKGNLPLGLALVLIDTMLAPLIMPALLHFIVGEKIAIDTSAIMTDLLWMIVLPSIAGIVINELTKGAFVQRYGKTLAPFSKLALFAIVMLNSSAIAPYVKNISWELAGVISAVFFVSISGYIFAYWIGKFVWKDASIRTTFVFSGGMRNIAVGVVIATTYFPAKVAMPVVFGMLFQQVLAALFSKVVTK
ncbi:MAG: bile acid:sodium symporter family protein [Solibacillus sp.]